MGSFLEILCAVLIPPVGVFLRFGCGVICFSYIYHLYLTLIVEDSNLFFLTFGNTFFAVGVLALFAPDVLWFYPWNGICYMGSY